MIMMMIIMKIIKMIITIMIMIIIIIIIMMIIMMKITITIIIIITIINTIITIFLWIITVNICIRPAAHLVANMRTITHLRWADRARRLGVARNPSRTCRVPCAIGCSWRRTPRVRSSIRRECRTCRSGPLQRPPQVTCSVLQLFYWWWCRRWEVWSGYSHHLQLKKDGRSMRVKTKWVSSCRWSLISIIHSNAKANYVQCTKKKIMKVI